MDSPYPQFFANTDSPEKSLQAAIALAQRATGRGDFAWRVVEQRGWLQAGQLTYCVVIEVFPTIHDLHKKVTANGR